MAKVSFIGRYAYRWLAIQTTAEPARRTTCLRTDTFGTFVLGFEYLYIVLKECWAKYIATSRFWPRYAPVRCAHPSKKGRCAPRPPSLNLLWKKKKKFPRKILFSARVSNPRSPGHETYTIPLHHNGPIPDFIVEKEKNIISQCRVWTYNLLFNSQTVYPLYHGY